MKTMTCKQLAGACDKEFQGESFEAIAEMSKQHGTEMFQQKDAAHLQAMEAMGTLMATPNGMQDWFAAKKKEFDALAND